MGPTSKERRYRKRREGEREGKAGEKRNGGEGREEWRGGNPRMYPEIFLRITMGQVVNSEL